MAKSDGVFSNESVALGAKTPLDYESAWQLTGALRAVVAGYGASGPRRSRNAVRSQDQIVDRGIVGVGSFPVGAGRVESVPQTGAAAVRCGKTAQDFNPEQFRDKLGEIVKLLGQSPNAAGLPLAPPRVRSFARTLRGSGSTCA